METRKTSKSYSPEVRERAVRMVAEHRGDHASEWAALVSISGKIGCNAEAEANCYAELETRAVAA